MWDETGDLGVASLGALVLMGGILQSWDSARDVREREPCCAGEGFPRPARSQRWGQQPCRVPPAVG